MNLNLYTKKLLYNVNLKNIYNIVPMLITTKMYFLMFTIKIVN